MFMLSHVDPNVLSQLQKLVGKAYVLTDDQQTRQYRQGRRFGEGKVLAVVCPGTLLEQWQVLQAVIGADCIVIMQAANTGADRRLNTLWRRL
jgi:D-lactate dehydrogenase